MAEKNKHHNDQALDSLGQKMANLRTLITGSQQPSHAENLADDENFALDEEHKTMDSSAIEDLFTEMEQEVSTCLADLQQQNQQLKNARLECLADMENVKRRVHEEQVMVKKYRAAGVAEKMLPALDNFERALQVQNVTPDVKNFLIGFDMIYKAIKQALNDEGVMEIKVNVGDEFDHNIHNAVDSVVEEGVAPNKILAVLQKGYMLHDRVLRHAAVKVSK